MSQPTNTILPVHPREILREEFPELLGVYVYALVLAHRIPNIWNHEA